MHQRQVYDHLRSRRPTGRHDRGQASLELALCLPLVLVFMLLFVQVAVVVRDQLAVQAAARDGARAEGGGGEGVLPCRHGFEEAAQMVFSAKALCIDPLVNYQKFPIYM